MVVEELDELFGCIKITQLCCTRQVRISQDIIEDELIVAIPMVPKHPNGCGQYEAVFGKSSRSEEKSDESAYVDTHRPFRDLALKFKGQDRTEV